MIQHYSSEGAKTGAALYWIRIGAFVALGVPAALWGALVRLPDSCTAYWTMIVEGAVPFYFGTVMLFGLSDALWTKWGVYTPQTWPGEGPSAQSLKGVSKERTDTEVQLVAGTGNLTNSKPPE